MKYLGYILLAYFVIVLLGGLFSKVNPRRSQDKLYRATRRRKK